MLSEETYLRRELTDRYKFILKRLWQKAGDEAAAFDQWEKEKKSFEERFLCKLCFVTKSLGNGRYRVRSFKA